MTLNKFRINFGKSHNINNMIFLLLSLFSIETHIIKANLFQAEIFNICENTQPQKYYVKLIK